MRAIVILIIGLVFNGLLNTSVGHAASTPLPDRFIGDASIYTGDPPDMEAMGRPNVLFIIDNSSSTENFASGEIYDPDKDYDQTNIIVNGNVTDDLYERNGIYGVDNQGDITRLVTTLDELNCTGIDSNGNEIDVISDTLNTYGTYSGTGTDAFPTLNPVGGGCSPQTGGEVYSLGNYMNYLQSTPAVPEGVDCVEPIIVHSYKNSNQHGYFQLNTTHTSACEPAKGNSCSDAVYWDQVSDPGGDVADWSLGVEYTMPVNPPECDTDNISQRDIIYAAIRNVVGSAAGSVYFAAMSYDQIGQKGGYITAEMADLSQGLTGKYNPVTDRLEYFIDCEVSTNANVPQCAWLKKIPGPDRNGDDDYWDDGDTDGYTILSSETSRPQAEALFDAGYYYGAFPASSGISPNAIRMDDDNPLRNPCGRNHIILITNGFTNESTIQEFTKYVGDADNDGVVEDYYGLGTHWLDDTAKHLKQFNDITTHTVLAFQSDDPLLKNAAKVDGGGQYYNVQNAAELADALTDLLRSIIVPKDTSFVAPVVPASTTNRTVSNNRVYLGLFKPQQRGHWHGNIKKYGINEDNVLTDVLDADATDVYGNFYETSVSFWSGDGTSHVPNAGPEGQGEDLSLTSDGRLVDAGGAGGLLLKRLQDQSSYLKGGGADDSTNPYKRNIFTYVKDETTDPPSYSKVMLDWLNTGLSLNDFNLPDTELGWWQGSAVKSPAESGEVVDDDTLRMRNLLRYLHGFESLDASQSSDVYSVRDWVLADVLHSRPVVFNFTKYKETYTTADSQVIETEGVCPPLTGAYNPVGTPDNPGPAGTYNSSYIFVGSNDGMLHAFRDCDGSEAWSFVPENLMNDLKYLPENDHANYVDSAPSVFYFDVNNDGNIDPSEDAAILIVGQRRGGGKDLLDQTSSRGSYYALDISNPEDPKVLWELSSVLDGGSEQLAETWSMPKIGKIKISGTEDEYLWVAFFGAGYDNNEDFRYGNTQMFPSYTSIDPDTGATLYKSVSNAPYGGEIDGSVIETSGGSEAGYHMRGRGLFAVEIGRSVKDGGGQFKTVVDPNVYSSIGTVIWDSFSNDTVYSFASDVRTLDLNSNSGWIDHLYVGDTGGNLWRVNTADRLTSNWTREKIFSSNPGYSNGSSDSTVGRKIFYPPSVASAAVGSAPWVCFGTGDRVHPLNLAVTDRLYCIRDFGQGTTDDINESNLVDVTENALQASTTSESDIATILAKLSSSPENPFLEDGTEKVYYGWYIRLDGRDRISLGDPGEKSLSEAVIFNNEVFFSTFQVDNNAERTQCQAGNPGVARLYRVSLKTGEAVFNYDTYNDDPDPDPNDPLDGDGVNLRRTDRVKTLGEGIPSGVVQIVDASGRVGLIISSSDTVQGMGSSNPSTSFPLYWLQR